MKNKKASKDVTAIGNTGSVYTFPSNVIASKQYVGVLRQL